MVRAPRCAGAVAVRRAPGVVVLAALTALLPAVPVPAQEVVEYEQRIEEESAELGRARSELEKARQEAKTYAARETSVLKQLNDLDNELQLKERVLTGLARKEERMHAELAQIRGRLQEERVQLAERRGILQRRLRNIYKVGEHPGLQVLLSSTSAVDLIRRFDWLLLVASQDRLLADKIDESLEAVRTAEQDLVAKQEDVRRVRRESEDEKAEIIRKKDERGALLTSVRTERRKREGLVQELEQAEKDLKLLLEDLQERAKRAAFGTELPPEGTGFAEMKGKLPWPVQGRVSRWFGVQKDERFGTSTFNGGVDIEAERKSEVLAVHRGRADYVNWLPGYGQCIIVNHGGGYFTLYAHTSAVMVSAGDPIERGDVIATVGDTGSLMGNVLHFEIRKDAEPINPAPWMSATKLR
ncbi:MAG TPA: peptidoglycan DD-metalloendopeptidase family protein [bacterium]|nr:peptidoglycan DD-metalloendopeptidase family protein [bacterium]